MKKLIFTTIFIVLCSSAFTKLFACSSIFLKTSNQMIFGRNHDYYNPNAVIIFNPKNLLKSGIPFPGENIPRWKSKYSSITISAAGVPYANSGMNEKGLAIGHMGLGQTVYPDRDERPVVSDAQWIQYMLDNCANTGEVLELANTIRIIQSATGNHYFVCDSSGNTAIIEFLNGEMVVHTNENMPYAVLCNDPYEKSMNDIKKFKGLGGDQPVLDRSSVIRDETAVANAMAIGCTKIKQFYESESIDIIQDAFSIHSAMSTPPPTSEYDGETQYTSVYDISNLKLYFRTKDNKNIRKVDFKMFEDDCSVKAKLLDIRTTGIGIVNNLFVDFSVQENRKAIDNAISIEATKPSEEMLDLYARYPDSFECEK
jgi:penicillin V acylase-like amidase (Ntn superfamily)